MSTRSPLLCTLLFKNKKYDFASDDTDVDKFNQDVTLALTLKEEEQKKKILPKKEFHSISKALSKLMERTIEIF